MADQNTVIEPPAPDAGISQDAIVDSFQEEFVDQESGQAIEPEKGKIEPQKPTAKPVKTEQPAAPAARAGAQAPAAQAKPDELIKPFQDDKGAFSADKFVEYFGKAKPPQFTPYKPTIEPPPAPVPGQDANQPAWRKELDDRRKYETSMKESLFMFEGLYDQALKAGYPDIQARQWARQQVQDRLNEHLTERDYENRAKQQEEAVKQQAGTLEMERLKPVADSNRAIVAQEFGGIENLDRLLTHEALGGQYVLWLFNLQNPGAKYKSADDFKATIDNWWVKSIAQNPDNIRRIAQIGMNAYRDKYFPNVIDHIKAKQAGGATVRRAAVTAGTRTVQSPAPAGAQNVLDEFMTPGELRETKQEP
ncbi:hypothetical protein CCP3SC15_380029 [Gammaproteobacteria bacterium]